MKKILFGTLAGLFISSIFFAWGWKDMIEEFHVPRQEGKQRFCSQIDVCQKCNRDFSCLKNECKNNPDVKGNCQLIEEGWKDLPIELDRDTFVSSLCPKDIGFLYNKNCLEEQNNYSELNLRIALIRVSNNTGISKILYILGIYELSFFGFIFLLIPPLVGFLVGWVLYFSKKRKNN